MPANTAILKRAAKRRAELREEQRIQAKRGKLLREIGRGLDDLAGHVAEMEIAKSLPRSPLDKSLLEFAERVYCVADDIEGEIINILGLESFLALDDEINPPRKKIKSRRQPRSTHK